MLPGYGVEWGNIKSPSIKATGMDGVCYSVQLDGTVVDCLCAVTHGLASDGLCSYILFASLSSSSRVLAGGVGLVSGC